MSRPLERFHSTKIKSVLAFCRSSSDFFDEKYKLIYEKEAPVRASLR